ncbi:MAG: hypothetical protein ACJ764_09280 [Solirubrobacteraceae bacterium]
MVGGESSGRRSLARVIAALLTLAAMVILTAGSTQAVASQATPTDPDFNPCEQQTTAADIASGCNNDEQWNLYGALSYDCSGQPRPDGGLPCWAPAAADPQHAAGVDMTGAWGQGNVGRPDVLVAYIEGGVNYNSDGLKDALDNIYINKGELPYPQDSGGQSHGKYDLNGDGHFDVRDYAQDPRVNPSCPSGTAPFANHQEGVTWSCLANGQHSYLDTVKVANHPTPYLSPEDLIAVFGHCQITHHLIGQAGCPAGGRFDNDHNGYPGDVSGWNFDRNTNDPQTEETTYGHAPGLIGDVGGEADNGYAGVGECRGCSIVPVKQGAECLGRPDHWGAAILYATDLGATTISSVVVSYAQSSFNQEAVDYAYNHGVSLALDSNDFDSMDHTDGMLLNHVIPGNSLAFDQNGTGLQPNATTWFRARSSTTSYGTHNIFSGYGTSTSGATPFMASMLGMVQSAGLNAVDQHVIPSPLTPDEVKQVMMDTASPVIPQTQSPQTQHQWPGNPNSATNATHTNWSTQYGYGRPDIGAATAMVMAGHLPPTAEIDSPNWFTYVDPKTTKTLKVTGRLAPSRVNSGGKVNWVLEYAVGADPADPDFHTISSGSASNETSGTLGTLHLDQIPASYYTHSPTTTLQPDGAEQYTVSLRLRVVDTNGLKGEDRRSIGVRHDPSLQAGAPLQFGSEISGAPTYADLQGRHQEDLVFSTYDGDVHALRPNGTELPGFPVHSSMIRSFDPRAPENFLAPAYVQNAAFRNQLDPLSGIAVGDLTHDGQQDVVATGMNGRVYAWDGFGHQLRGFPRMMPTPAGQYDSPTPQAGGHSRSPLRGAWASPVLAPLEGARRLDIIIPGWDGKVYAWRPDGTRVPGWPVTIKLPHADFARDGVDPTKFIHDPKLMYSVGVADVLGKGKPQVFVSSFDCSGSSSSTQDTGLGLTPIGSNPASKAWLYGIWADGHNHSGGAYLPHWPAALPALDFCYDQSIDFVGEGVAPPDFAKIGGGWKIVSAAVTGNVEALNPDGSVFSTFSADCASAACSANPPYRPSGDTHTLTLTGQGGLGDLSGSGTPQYVASSTGLESILLALGQAGQANLPQVYEKVWDVASGDVQPGFPQRQDGFPFYDAPITADVAGGSGGTREAIEANDNYFIHAWGPSGAEAAGFPKYTGQWTGFVGAVGDPLEKGHLQLVYATREGDVFRWNVPGSAPLNNSWWHYRHDEWNTGQYGLDTRPPAPVGSLSAKRVARWLVRVSFVAPGGDGMVGKAKRYQVRAAAATITPAGWHPGRVELGAPKPSAAGHTEQFTVHVPRRDHYLAVRALDQAGNLGPGVSVPIR